LVLIGGLSAGAFTSCGPGDLAKSPVSAQNVYTNNYYVPGVGYYHAPFRTFFSLPYNHFEPQNQRYFFGGQWATAPHQSITNISPPTPAVAQQAEAQRTDIPRGGFGSSSQYHSVYS
jgi:hypothetical protein